MLHKRTDFVSHENGEVLILQELELMQAVKYHFVAMAAALGISGLIFAVTLT